MIIIDSPDLPVVIGPQRDTEYRPGDSFYWLRYVGVEHPTDAKGYRHIEVPVWIYAYNAAYGDVVMAAYSMFDASVLSLGYSHLWLYSTGEFYSGEFVATLLDVQEDHFMNASNSGVDANGRVGLGSINLPFAKLRYSYGGDYPFSIEPFGVKYNPAKPHYFISAITHNELVGTDGFAQVTGNRFSFYDAKNNQTATYLGGNAYSDPSATLGSGGASTAAYIPLANHSGLVVEHYASSANPREYDVRGWIVAPTDPENVSVSALSFTPIDCSPLVDGWRTVPHQTVYSPELERLVDTMRLSEKIPIHGLGTLFFGRRSNLVGDNNTAFTCYLSDTSGVITRRGDLVLWYGTTESTTFNWYMYGVVSVGENTLIALFRELRQTTPPTDVAWRVAKSQDNGASWWLTACNLPTSELYGFNPFSLNVTRMQDSATSTGAKLILGGFENQTFPQGGGSRVDTYIWSSEDGGATWTKGCLLDKQGAYDNMDQTNNYLRMPSHLMMVGNEDGGFLPKYPSHPTFFGDFKWRGTLYSNIGNG